MTTAQDTFKKCSPWMRLSICINIHVTKALINVLHNHINEPLVNGLPSDPADLYAFFQTNKKTIKKSTFIKKHQESILLPAIGQSVDSSTFDVSLTRCLIQTFCRIRNAKGNWTKPDATDHTICANVYRAADMRNSICHDNNIEEMKATEFEKKWKQLKEILQGLKYFEDIEPFKAEKLNIAKYEDVILEEFVDYLRSYKEECKKEKSQDDYIERRFAVGGNKNNIVTESDFERLLEDNDCVFIHGEAGMGKSSTAKHIKKEWCNQKIFRDLNILYFDSKKMNKQLNVQSHGAPLYFSELGHYLKKNGRTEDDLSIYSCVKTTIEKLVILIDGIDEFPIRDLVTGNYVDKLERKVKNNDEINAADTIVAIYFGFLFPNTNICLLGRNNEFKRLKEFLSNNTNRGIKDLELLKFDDANVKEFTCLNICQQQSNGPRNCTCACIDIYEKIKDIELCKTPTDLNSLIKLHKKHPNENVGRITRTKLIIAILLNRLNEHSNQKNYFPSATFGNIRKQKDFSKYLEGIRTLGEISFKSVLKNNVTISVEEELDNVNGVVHFKYKNQISIERKTLEELDIFYVRDLDYYSILEPHHTLNIEFLCGCYLFSNPDEMDSILKLNVDRQLEIISFIAGLHAGDYFTKDFVKNVLHRSSYSLEQFFSWLYNVGNVRKSLPNGIDNYNCWFGLMETQKLSPSLFLLDSISQEVDIPQAFIPTTIVCYCFVTSEWYDDMEYLKHNLLTKLLDKLNIESFLKKFLSFKFIIKGDIMIDNNDELNRLNQCGANSLITFRINTLYIRTPLDTSFSSHFNVNTLDIGWDKCDSRTIGMMLNALPSPPKNTSSSNIQPVLKCKRLRIPYISTLFNPQQTKKLFELCLCGVVDWIALRYSTFFTDKQIDILEDAERKTNTQINIVNIELRSVNFDYMFGLPNLGERHISLRYVFDVTDSDVNDLRKHIRPGYSYNLNKYKIINAEVPFVRKEQYPRDNKHSMFLNFCQVDFSEVSPEVFANTFSMVHTLSFMDDSQRYGIYLIPSSHWSRLSQTNDCRLHEMRIWEPRPENFKYFLNIKTLVSQFICNNKYDLKQLLDYIVNNQDIELLNKELEVFVVKVDDNNWDYYKESTIFSGITIEKYRNDYSSENLQLDNICVSYHEGEKDKKWWCCELSQSF